MDVPTTSSSFFIAVHVTVRGYMRAYVCADLRGPSSFCSQKKKINLLFLMMQKFRAQFSSLRLPMYATPNEQTCKKTPRM